MLCSNAQNLILEVVTDEAEVPAAEREAFFAHVGWCSGCREEYEQEQAIRLALQTYGELSSDTVEILESRGQVVGGGHLSSDVNEPHGLDEAVQAMDVEVGLARLMEAVDAREAQCGEEEGGFEGSRSLRGLEDSVADLRRRVNTLEAYQEPVREVWRSQASGVGGARAMDTLSTSWRNVPVWPVAACLSAAACLVFSLVVGWLYAADRVPRKREVWVMLARPPLNKSPRSDCSHWFLASRSLPRTSSQSCCSAVGTAWCSTAAPR